MNDYYKTNPVTDTPLAYVALLVNAVSARNSVRVFDKRRHDAEEAIRIRIRCKIEAQIEDLCDSVNIPIDTLYKIDEEADRLISSIQRAVLANL